jgi:protein phosphatase 1 regulatory subunit 37
VSALRTTFTVNTSLKRLFLSDTGLTTDGAISLAEFLPETKSLLHLDLTSNPLIETAGILALSVGLKSNKLIRCLDLSIPPNSPDLAELSQSILQSCIRNTELAADTAKPGPSQDAVWQPIKKSALVKDVKAADRARQDRAREEIANSSEGQAREFVYTLKPDRLAPQAEEVVRIMERWFDAGKAYSSKEFNAWGPGQLPRVDYEAAYERAKVLRERIVDRIQEDVGPEEMESLLGVNDILASILEQGIKFQPPPRLLLPSQINTSIPSTFTQSTAEPHQLQTQQSQQPRGLPRNVRRHMRIPSLEISSPNFSIGDSDNDSDAEELDVGAFPSPSQPPVGLPGVGFDEELLNVASGGAELGSSPVERASRAWVEEEGEIFRKGTKLGVAEDGDEEESGEQLKKEVSHESCATYRGEADR